MSINRPLAQVLTILTTTQIFILAAQLIYSRRWDLVRFIRRFPRLFFVEMMFLFHGIEPHPSPTLPTSHLPGSHSTIRSGDADGREDAGSSTSGVELREVSVASPQMPTHSPHESLPKESRQSGDTAPGYSDALGFTEPDSDDTRNNCAGPPKCPTTDVPLTAVQDIILAISQKKTTIESLELICATHGLNPLVTGSVLQVARESMSPVCEKQRYL